MRKLLCVLGGICILATSMVVAHSYSLNQGPAPEDSSGARPDLLILDAMAVFGPLEKAPVAFLHDAHTQALARRDIDCSACHPGDEDRMSLKFKRFEDDDRVAVMNIYHQGCIACHGEMNLAGETTGPVQCDGCHRDDARFSSSRQPVGFDKSLHFRHSQAQDNQCERCHHAYDDQAEALFYAKGKEGTCRYCHRSETEGNRISMRSASHTACIECHRRNQVDGSRTGPVECAGCHDAAAREQVETVASVPRMQRQQPDITLLKRAQPGGDGETLNRMSLVPFDHEAHEGYTSTCRSCHHESLETCVACHTLSGNERGGHVPLEKAAHRMDSARSCRGCHRLQQEEKNCAGCHRTMGKRPAFKEDSCRPCHMTPGGEDPLLKDPDQEDLLAAEMLRSRTPVSAPFIREDIPDTVVIGQLSDQYEAVAFPHRKIVDALAETIQDSRLAAYFHPGQGTLCQGCHHNSPASEKPPRCAACHGNAFDGGNHLKPGIMGAYHLQCMGCHQDMGIEKPAGCTDCHKKKIR